VVFGGATKNGTGADDGDTWTWNGSTWTSLGTSGPSTRHWPGLATLGGNAVLFGGYSIATGSTFADTWTFNGSSWTAQSPAHSPAARMAAELSGP